MNQNPYRLMTTTAGDRAEAERLAEMLVAQRLAACVQLTPVDSVYRWAGKVERAAEVLLLIKTRIEQVEAAIAAIRAAHSYDTPEILALPIETGLPAYLAWIDGSVG